MGFSQSGEMRLRVIGCDNYNGDANWIVAYKYNEIKDNGEIGVITTVAYKIEAIAEGTMVEQRLPEGIFDFSCFMDANFIVYTYSIGTRSLGSVTNRYLVIIDMKTGNSKEFTEGDLQMITGDEEDVTPEGYKRWQMLTGIGLLSYTKEI